MGYSNCFIILASLPLGIVNPGTWLDLIGESPNEETTNSSDSRSNENKLSPTVKDHMNFLDSISNISKNLDGDVIDSSSQIAEFVIGQQINNLVATQQKTVRKYKRISNKTKRLVESTINPCQSLKSKDCLNELVAEVFNIKYGL